LLPFGSALADADGSAEGSDAALDGVDGIAGAVEAFSSGAATATPEGALDAGVLSRPPRPKKKPTAASPAAKRTPIGTPSAIPELRLGCRLMLPLSDVARPRCVEASGTCGATPYDAFGYAPLGADGPAAGYAPLGAPCPTAGNAPLGAAIPAA
jgi:hypothetical protein